MRKVFSARERKREREREKEEKLRQVNERMNEFMIIMTRNERSISHYLTPYLSSSSSAPPGGIFD